MGLFPPVRVGLFCSVKNTEAGSVRRLHNEELHKFYSPLNFIRVIKSGRTRWAGHVVRMKVTRNAYKIEDENYNRDLEDLADDIRQF
jgi:hypothetical protein